MQPFFSFFFFLQNKKQRMMVRHAVLKGKDPMKLLEEMEAIDRMGVYCYGLLKLCNCFIGFKL
jgi:hypothetical protein